MKAAEGRIAYRKSSSSQSSVTNPGLALFCQAMLWIVLDRLRLGICAWGHCQRNVPVPDTRRGCSVIFWTLSRYSWHIGVLVFDPHYMSSFIHGLAQSSLILI